MKTQGKKRTAVQVKRLRKLHQEYGQVCKQMQPVDYVLSGTLLKRSYRCGKKSCRCHKDPQALHGPYYQWSRKVQGKTISMTLEAPVAKKVEQWIAHGRLLRQSLRRLEQISKEILSLSEDLDIR